MKRDYIIIGLFMSAALASCQKNIDKLSTQASSTQSTQSVSSAGDVYTMTNSTDGNRLVHYRRDADGKLDLEGSYNTGGIGTGIGLHSQGSVVLSDDGAWLFAVNAGSNDISVFNVSAGKPQWVDKTSSHGVGPVSVAVHGSWLYVLNAGPDFTGSVTGFSIGTNGHLHYIENSKKLLDDHMLNGGAEIAFNSSATSLIITERNANNIVTFTLDENGLLHNKKVMADVGSEPFGFAVDNAGYIYVSEASHGVAGKSSVSSYSVSNTGKVKAVDPLNFNQQTAACWVVLTRDYRFAYVSNTGSNTITGYKIHNGNLDPLNDDGVASMTGLLPQDEAISMDSKFLYVLNQGDQTIGGYAVDAMSGALTPIGHWDAFNHKSQGLAAK